MKKRLFVLFITFVLIFTMTMGTQSAAFAQLSNSDAASSIAADWMKYASDDLYISQLSIPGTHDSGTKECAMGQCQGKTIEWQLEHGVRFLDIRLVIGDSVDDLRVYHGEFSAELNFGDVMKTVKTFLEENPSECIIMSIKNEKGDREQHGKNFDEYLEEKYIENSDWKDLFYTKTSIPKLSEARGKVVLLRRYGNSSLGLNASSGWTDKGKDITINKGTYKIRVQDYYSPDTNLPLSSKAKAYAKDEKKPAVEAFDEKAKSGSSSNTLWINFTSGNILGLCTDDVADVLNPYIEEKFKDDYLKGVFHGIVAMDWVEDSESQAVFMTNKLERKVNFEIRVNDQSGKTLKGSHTIKLGSADGLGKTYDVNSNGNGTYTANIDPRETSLKLKIDNKEIDTLSVDTESERLSTGYVYQLVYKSSAYIAENDLPTDNNVYKSGESVTVSTKTYEAEGDITFLGWSVNGSSVGVGETFTIGTNRYTLTDMWRNPAQSWTDYTTLKSECYYVNVDTTVKNLRVQEEANPVVIVPEGITLTCNGSDGATWQLGGKAGIYVPEGASITFVGGGTVYAYGGDAASGEAGRDGGTGKASKDGYSGGSGAPGGAGGAGAGAGIGTDGGLGASAGTNWIGSGTNAIEKKSYSGKNGGTGNDGKAAAAAGTVYNDGVSLVAKGGSAGQGGAGGSAGASVTYKAENNYYTASGGGGGGGGAGGSAGADIGTGGTGGGGGSYGGEGGCVYNSGNGKSAGGEGGKGGYSGTAASTSGTDGKNGTSALNDGETYYNNYAGKSSSGGKGGTATSKTVQSNSPYIKSTVTLDSSKNSTTNATSSGTTSLSAYYGKAYGKITVPSLTGYTFGGYWTGRNETNVGGEKFYQGTGIQAINSKGESKKEHDSFENMTLYASWQPIKYTIAYNANGGSGSMSSDTNRSYDVSYRLKANTYTRDGYIFSGWATNASSTTARYQDASSVKNITSTNAATVTLYAVWEKEAEPTEKVMSEANAKIALWESEEFKALYSEAEQKKLADIVSKTKSSIKTATTNAAVETAIQTAESEIAELETKDEQLAQKKADAKAELQSYKSNVTYRDAEAASRNSIITEGVKAIENAASVEQVDSKLAEYKAKIDALKTAADYEADEAAELAAAKAEAIEKLSEGINESDYDADKYSEIKSCINEGEAKINAATTKAEVESALNAALVKRNAIPTKAQTENEAFENAKQSAIETLQNYGDVETQRMYRYKQRIELKKIIRESVKEINKISAESGSASISTALAEAMEKIEKLPTGSELDTAEVKAALERLAKS